MNTLQGSKISQKATSKSTSQMDRKRRKQKKKDSTKGIDGLDILDQHTHNKLVEMEEERKSIYNFDVCIVFLLLVKLLDYFSSNTSFNVSTGQSMCPFA
ncbi:hypothetical protein DPMN_179071 [Dreissena polymorpha]|uniref:Uncharacterized protein n=1 Tax=Dreissena polymorpha TaxID=45954 RepID=A0A9D4EDC3_DREPO|nr:hypothetical protein DPMN_179071 [Dreissena polymorpha]